MSQFIDVAADAGVLTIRINRAEKKNALTADMYAGLASALDKAFDEDAVRVALILGLPGVFSAGNDIGDFLKVAMSGERDSMAVFDFLERIIMAPKPVVAGVDGLAIGVGVTMLMHCDHVIASDRASFTTPFVDLGLLPEAGSSLIAPRIMGHHLAFELLAMGETFDAAKAQSAGLVNKVVASDALEGAAGQAARAIAAKPPEALAQTRQLVRGDRSDVLARMKEEARLWEARLASDEAKAAFMAFVSKGQKKAS